MLKSILKKTQKNPPKTDRQNPRINGKSKAMQTKSHKEPYNTHSQKEKKEKYIYIFVPKFHRLNFGMIHCVFRYSTDAGTAS